MRWLVVALFALALIVTIFVVSPFETIYDDGLWPLSVTVRSAGARPIKGISAEAFVGIEQAQEMLAELPPLALTRAENSIYAAVQEPKVADPLKVNIPTSETSHRSLIWTHRKFFQYRGLLVVVEYEGGMLEGRAVEIPDLRGARNVSVEVP